MPLDMNVSVNSCLPFYVDPAMAWRSIQRAPHLSPYRSSSYPAMLKITKETMDGIDFHNITIICIWEAMLVLVGSSSLLGVCRAVERIQERKSSLSDKPPVLGRGMTPINI